MIKWHKQHDFLKWLNLSPRYKNTNVTSVTISRLSLAENSVRLTFMATAAARAALLVLSRVCSIFVCVQTVVWLPLSGICNVHANGHACDCTLGLCGHRKRVCTERWLVSGRKSPCRIRDSNPRQHGAWRFGPTLYKLSHIPSVGPGTV